MNRKKGFTLMELVIAVGVLLVLALLALLVLDPKTSIDKAYDAQRKKDLKNLRIAFENYYADYSCYPTQEQISNCGSNELDPYIKEIPCDPVSNIPYELIAEPSVCPQNFIAYAQLKYTEDSSASIDDFNCFFVKSPNITTDPNHNCTEYFDPFVPTSTPSSPTGAPTETPTETPPPTPDKPYYYCSSLNNCTQLPIGKTCNPSFPWPDTYCSGACSDPSNICTPQ